MIGVLLINLGTPDAPEVRAVRRYLAEFLSDPRVVEIALGVEPCRRWQRQAFFDDGAHTIAELRIEQGVLLSQSYRRSMVRVSHA